MSEPEMMGVSECDECGWIGSDDLVKKGSVGSNVTAVCPECGTLLYTEYELTLIPLDPGELHELLDDLLGD